MITDTVAEITTKPSILRKYLYEYALIALSACVVFLFLAFNDLNKFIRTQMNIDKVELIRTIDRNTDAVNRFLNHEKLNDNGNK